MIIGGDIHTTREEGTRKRRGGTHKSGNQSRLLLAEGMDEEENVDNSLHFELLKHTAEDTERPRSTNGGTAWGGQRQRIIGTISSYQRRVFDTIK